jgi:hypothetical protein
MTAPTIERRLQKKAIIMSANQAMIARCESAMLEGWELVALTDLEDAGEWNQLLLYRFLLLDLDEIDQFDPLDVIREIRMQYQINIPVFCFGGDIDIQEEMRLSRADRFFSADELVSMLPQFCENYNW